VSVDPTSELILAPTTAWGRFRERLARSQPRQLGLRTRIFLMFGFGALFLAVFLATVAYTFTRSSVVTERDRAALEQAYRNAQVAQNELSTNNPSASAALERLRSLGVSRFAINYRGTWSAPTAQ
jgi:hypothetical protein